MPPIREGHAQEKESSEKIDYKTEKNKKRSRKSISEDNTKLVSEQKKKKIL